MNQTTRTASSPGKGSVRPLARNQALRQGLLVVLAALPLLLAGRGLALDATRSVFQYNCQNWTHVNGLPVDKINAITQTKDGYVWLGTQNGLVRFDGFDFKDIPINLPSARGQEVRQLVVANNGRLDFAINYGGFGSYGGGNFSMFGDTRWSQPNMNATTLLAARDGAIWTAADLGVGRWLPEQTAASWFGSRDSGTVITLYEDAPGRIWLGTAEHGLSYWTNGKFVPFPAERLKQENIAAVAVDAANQVWVGTGNGLRCYSAGGQPRAIPAFDAAVKALLLDRHGILWVGTWGMGLARYANGKFDYLRTADGLGSDYVTSLFEDAEGSLWVGTRDGLSQLTDVKFPIYAANEGIVGGSSLSVCASRKGGLYITTDSGVFYCDGRTATNYCRELALPNQYIKLGFEARNGDLYLVDGNKNVDVVSGNHLVAQIPNQDRWPSAFTEDAQSVLVAQCSGVDLARLEAGSLRPYAYAGGTPPLYYWINSLCVARDGAVWVASNHGILRLKDGHFKQWLTADGLFNDQALYICQDADGSIWAGSVRGIIRIKDNVVRTITPEEGLPANRVYAIVPDDVGSLWFDSDRGIFRVGRQSLNEVADGKSKQIKYDLFDGLEAVKFTDRTEQDYSGCKTLDGRIWFPCPWGVVMIDPAHLPTNLIPPPVHIDQVRANGSEMAPGETLEVPPGKGELEFHFSGLSFIAPQKIQFRYQLEGYDKDWVAAANQHAAYYTNLKPGHYVFRVTAANADGVWNPVGDSLVIKLHPFFHQTVWFYLLCGGLAVAVLGALYAWRVQELNFKQRALQRARNELEAEVANRTAELARANASLLQEVAEHRGTSVLLAGRTQLLEQQIAERGRMQIEIEQIHQRLLESSRQAGMAEVATNVLHNVGNVLNSVNVSALLVTDGAKKSQVSFVGKIAALLEEHAADLGGFLTTDPRGRQVPVFLSQLATQLAGEQQQTIQELELLRQNIEHIKEIVAMQQNYARISGVLEIIPAGELVENALSMNAAALHRHGVTLLREYETVPALNVEKHKVLQILVNLIRNAKYACIESDRLDKTIRILIAPDGPGVRIVVIDNGVGIPPENLNRIFSHGFTTRKGGHGFGLHSGALAARELGGTLAVQSDGRNQGATFTLTLPWQPPLTKS